ncbi:hypothetical protein FisN_3Lh403 [Fistulifera solaris]|uniref:Uncharacterized protein n=1 Tax=Fistulifera solaris TaxID=1519565 RepID=A0A1Z5J8D0_FISSO|nr:hypothetical protein FisN_3Lh403 [Fistulifera solaris]|eukprot:GAX10206.1 hypothetical protein FisN_3Lh403 [Fistulifera solaris]
MSSQNFVNEAEGGSADDDSPERWTMNAPISQSLGGRPIVLPQLRQNNGNRSNPIAIVRNDNGPYPESSDDELDDDDDDINTIHLELDALSIETENSRRVYTSSSLPNHLLRAPRLTAISDNDNKLALQYPAMLPPAMTSADNPLGGVETEDRTSYGSLRDSNSRGRFLDGPSSYRDKNTGDIRALEHRVRYRSNNHNLSQSLPASLSIGERIMQSRLKRKESASSQDNHQPSSLSALMEASTDNSTISSPMQQAEDTAQQTKNRTVTFYDEDFTRDRPSDMLSTSLTGLEVLQAGFRGSTGASAQQSHALKIAFADLDKLPTDESGNNALLSRSLSDPNPEYSSSVTRPNPTNSNHRGEAFPPLQLALHPHSNAIKYTPDSQLTDPLQPSHDTNPDAELAFDMD